MAKLDAGSTLKRLRNRYRLVVMNDDTYEEVVTFKLSRLSVYIGLSTIFVVLVGLTVALIIFTPLKYYIPGYDDLRIGREYQQLKYDADKMSRELEQLKQYQEGLRKGPLMGEGKTVNLDTAQLQLPKEEISSD
ncbi:MAG: hypothetical protein JNK14_17985 [Chitinophagaceae bacterium]|nr:hypothetical protein [Chitinophagaceae bacterium]